MVQIFLLWIEFKDPHMILMILVLFKKLLLKIIQHYLVNIVV